MKNTIRLYALLAAIVCFAACQPHENNIELSNVRNIVYTVDQNTTSVTLQNDAEWNTLLEHLLDYAADGSTVSFYNTDHVAKGASKDVVEYSTTSREEMKAWMRRMEDAGMTVTVTYDSNTGTWNGTAYATAPSTNAGCVTYATPWGVDGTGVVMTFDTVNHIVYITTGTAPDQMAVHFPTGKYSYSHSGDQLLLHYYYSIAAVLEESLTITPAGGDTLDLTYNYQGGCYTDHTHRAQLVPTTLYTTLHCYNEAADITLHIDRTNNTIGFGQTAVVYNDESMYTNTDRPFSQGWFNYSFMDIGDNGLLLGLHFYENLGNPNTLFDIEYLGSNHEVWHRYSELGTTEAYNPLRDFGFDRIN